MKRKIITVFLCLFLITGLMPCTAGAKDGWTPDSATWQDPNNVVLIWTAQEGYRYRIYRSDTQNGDYQLNRNFFLRLLPG